MSSNRPLTTPKNNKITVQPIEFDGTAIQSALQKIAYEHKSSTALLQSLANNPVIHYKPDVTAQPLQDLIAKPERKSLQSFLDSTLSRVKPFLHFSTLNDTINLPNVKLMVLQQQLTDVTAQIVQEQKSNAFGSSALSFIQANTPPGGPAVNHFVGRQKTPDEIDPLSRGAKLDEPLQMLADPLLNICESYMENDTSETLEKLFQKRDELVRQIEIENKTPFKVGMRK